MQIKNKNKLETLTMSLYIEDSSQSSIFFASASKIQNNGLWGRRGKV